MFAKFLLAIFFLLRQNNLAIKRLWDSENCLEKPTNSTWSRHASQNKINFISTFISAPSPPGVNLQCQHESVGRRPYWIRIYKAGSKLHVAKGLIVARYQSQEIAGCSKIASYHWFTLLYKNIGTLLQINGNSRWAILWLPALRHNINFRYLLIN